MAVLWLDSHSLKNFEGTSNLLSSMNWSTRLPYVCEISLAECGAQTSQNPRSYCPFLTSLPPITKLGKMERSLYGVLSTSKHNFSLGKRLSKNPILLILGSNIHHLTALATARDYFIGARKCCNDLRRWKSHQRSELTSSVKGYGCLAHTVTSLNQMFPVSGSSTSLRMRGVGPSIEHQGK